MKNRFNQNLTKQEKSEIQKERVANAAQGQGWYLYKNVSKSDLGLPKKPKDLNGNDLKSSNIPPQGEFYGDDYFMSMVKDRQSFNLRLVKVIRPPGLLTQTEGEKIVNTPNTSEQLLVDQPDTITVDGKVENVVSKQPPVKNLNEQPKDENGEILLVDDAIDGVEILV